MKTAKRSSQRLPHGYGHWRNTGAMTPLPPARPVRPWDDSRLDWDSWQPRELHPEFSAPLRDAAVLILWLLGVLGMIALFAVFWI